MQKDSKNKITQDILREGRMRLYVSRGRNIRVPFTRIVQVLFAILITSSFFIGSVKAPQNLSTAAAQEQTQTATNADIQAQRAALEQQLAEYEKQIEETQKTIDEYKQKGGTLQNEIYGLNAKINKYNLEIKALNLNLSKLDTNINNTQRQINDTENKIDTHKQALSEGLQNVYETDGESLIEILLGNNRLSDFFGQLNNIALVQDNLRVSLENITKLRQDLLDQKNQLYTQKDDAENLKAIQQAQKNNVQATQSQKKTLLTQTKGQESVYQKVLQKTQASAAEIRSRIFDLLGGGQLTFEKAYDYAKLASSATGVRAALILAILNRESLLGKNTGRCSYETAMNPTRDTPYFLQLLSQLGIDPSSDFAKVSCANQHGSYGGAMGPAQFIPSTWKIYADRIAAATGHNPANPWNNSDAFTATAIYMSDLLGSASCKSYAEANKNVVSYQTLLERCAAAKYYAGGNWYTYRFWYGDPVVQQANAYEDDIAVLEKNGG